MSETAEAIRRALGRDADQGIALPDGSFAWSPSQCMQILESLTSTKVAVVSGEFFRAEPIGLVPAYDGWTCERGPGELASEYASRSREVAADQMRMESHSELHVVLQFSGQEDAA